MLIEIGEDITIDDALKTAQKELEEGIDKEKVIIKLNKLKEKEKEEVQ
jgi:hypothetical protein